MLNPGDSFLTSVQGFGKLAYHCTLHPEMSGSITAASPTASGATDNTTTEEAPTA